VRSPTKTCWRGCEPRCPDGNQADAVALWIAHTHAVDAADATLFTITSPEKRCGKSLLLLDISPRWLDTACSFPALVADT
jgi:hypothetical protein